MNNFYHIKYKSRADLVKQLKSKILQSKHVFTEELDCNVNFARQSTDLTITEILDLALNKNNSIHCSYKNGEITLIVSIFKPKIIEYFIWIKLKEYLYDN